MNMEKTCRDCWKRSRFRGKRCGSFGLSPGGGGRRLGADSPESSICFSPGSESPRAVARRGVLAVRRRLLRGFQF